MQLKYKAAKIIKIKFLFLYGILIQHPFLFLWDLPDLIQFNSFSVSLEGRLQVRVFRLYHISVPEDYLYFVFILSLNSADQDEMIVNG